MQKFACNFFQMLTKQGPSSLPWVSLPWRALSLSLHSPVACSLPLSLPLSPVALQRRLNSWATAIEGHLHSARLCRDFLAWISPPEAQQVVDLTIGGRRQLGGSSLCSARASRGRGSGAHGRARAPAAWGHTMDSAAGRTACAGCGAEASSVSASNLSPSRPAEEIAMGRRRRRA